MTIMEYSGVGIPTGRYNFGLEKDELVKFLEELIDKIKNSDPDYPTSFVPDIIVQGFSVAIENKPGTYETKTFSLSYVEKRKS